MLNLSDELMTPFQVGTVQLSLLIYETPNSLYKLPLKMYAISEGHFHFKLGIASSVCISTDTLYLSRSRFALLYISQTYRLIQASRKHWLTRQFSRGWRPLMAAASGTRRYVRRMGGICNLPSPSKDKTIKALAHPKVLTLAILIAAFSCEDWTLDL